MMEQSKLTQEPLKEKPSLIKPYARGTYNKFNDEEQWIRISEGCPNKCAYCRESFECGTEPIYFEIPEIIRNKVKILDMNLLYKPKAKEIIKELGSKRVNNKIVYYELICGVDYRYCDLEMCNLLKENHFINIRLAWDYGFIQQKLIKKVVFNFIESGYNSKDLMVFMLCNYKIPYDECCLKMDLCKVWNVQIHDAYFDNQLSPNIKPIYWTLKQIETFRHKTRKHNQMVNFKIDPEF